MKNSYQVAGVVLTAICALAGVLALWQSDGNSLTAKNGNSVLIEADNNRTVETFNIMIGGDLALSESAETIEVLGSIESLIRDLIDSGELALSDDGAANLSDGLVSIAEESIFPRFMIFEDQFTLSKGMTHILRDGQTTIGFRGFHQTGPMLFLNGADTRPRTGGTVEFQFDGQTCRLVNNAVDRERDEATFTVLC